MAGPRLRYRIHGLPAELTCHVPALLEPLDQALGSFLASSSPGQGSPISGVIRPFNRAEALRHLSSTATRLSGPDDLFELYQDAERFWLIDDHWGLCEINVLKGQWRSWILPSATADAQEIAEQAVLWPVAQLLRPRGLCMVPSAAVVRDGWGALIFSTFGIEPELTALVRAGFRIIGQNWTALREQGRQIVMLQMPGHVHRITGRSLRSALQAEEHQIDLTEEYCGSACDAAACDAVLLVAPGRRPLPHLRPITPTNAVGALRRAWPIVELHPHRRQGQLPARIARRCRVFEVQLSRTPQDLLSLMDSARYSRSPTPGVSVFVKAEPTRAVA